MTGNKHYEHFAAILSTIEEKGISTADELRLPKNAALWDELYFATEGFIDYYALASKTSRNKNGEIVPGNVDKVKFLMKKTGVELYDIQMDIFLHVMNKIDYVMAQSPVAKKASYTYKIVNNELNTMLRKLLVEIVSLDAPISENGLVLADVIRDLRYEPDRVLALKELWETHKAEKKAEQARERAEKREAILHGLALLSKPAEILVFLFASLGMKSSTIAEIIMENGAIRSCEAAIMRVSSEYDIPLAEIKKHLTGNVTEKALKLNSNDPNKVIDHVYHLRSRAKHRLDPKKHDEERHGERS